MYDIYKCAPEDADGDLVQSVDGGLCTGSAFDALRMAQGAALLALKAMDKEATRAWNKEERESLRDDE